MKALITALVLLTSAAVAKADGFVCTSESGLVVRVYNHVNAIDGTRTASQMIVSNQTIGVGSKTVASFSAEKGTLSSFEQTYIGKVDLRVSESSRKGELVGGTKLGYLKFIILSVDFSYSQPLPHGTLLEGVLTLQKRSGEENIEAVTCARYLKHE